MSRKKQRVKLICKQCGKEFKVLLSQRHTRKFCSNKCATASGPNRKPKVALTCCTCGKEFQVRPCQANRKYCSRKCTRTRVCIPIVKTCLRCSKEFTVRPFEDDRKFCGSKCANTKYPPPESRRCPVCNLPFTPPLTRRNQIYCSRKCYLDHIRIPTKICPVCQKPFTYNSHADQIHCSPQCQGEARKKRVTITCKNCGKPFQTIPSRKDRTRYCSRQCQLKHMYHSQEETAVVDILERLLNESALRQHSFPWLVSSLNRTMHIDAYFPQANLAVEYDGRHHQEYVPFYNKSLRAFHELQQRDREKELLFIQHDIPLLRIADNEPRTEIHLRQRLAMLAEDNNALLVV